MISFSADTLLISVAEMYRNSTRHRSYFQGRLALTQFRVGIFIFVAIACLFAVIPIGPRLCGALGRFSTFVFRTTARTDTYRCMSTINNKEKLTLIFPSAYSSIRWYCWSRDETVYYRYKQALPVPRDTSQTGLF